MALVEAGLGVGVVPGLALVDRPIRATVCPLDPPLQRRILVVVRPARRSHPAVASALTEFDLYSRERVPRGQPEGHRLRGCVEMIA